MLLEPSIGASSAQTAGLTPATQTIVVTDPTPPLLPRVPTWRTVLGLLLATIAITGACAESAYLLAASKPDVFRAESQIEYRGEAWVETAAAELTSRSRIEPIAEANSVAIKKFEERLFAGAVPGTQLLQFAYEDTDADRALRIVTELTDAYLVEPETSLEDSVERIAVEIDALRARLETARRDLASISVPPGDPSTSAERVAESEVNRIQDLLAAAQERQLEEELAVITAIDQRPEVVTDPFVLEERVAPQPVRRAAFGLLIGLVLSAALAATVLSRTPSR